MIGERVLVAASELQLISCLEETGKKMSQVPTCKEVARPWHGETPIKHATTTLKMLGCPAAAAHRAIVGMHPVQPVDRQVWPQSDIGRTATLNFIKSTFMGCQAEV